MKEKKMTRMPLSDDILSTVFDLYMTSIKDLYVRLHKRADTHHILSDYIKENLMDETALFQMADKTVRELHLFHTRKKSKKAPLYILTSAIPSFLKKHTNELVKLGIPRENIYAALGLISTHQATDDKSQLVQLWNITMRCTRNSKIVSRLSDFIKEKYLLETYSSTDSNGNTTKKPLFVFVKHKVGKCAVFMEKEGVKTFLERHKDEIQAYARLIEAENEFASLRYLASYLGSSNLNKKLTEFILHHIDETYEEQDENGRLIKQKMFAFLPSLSNGVPILNIRKRGILPFIEKHTKELEEIGFTSIPAIKKNQEKIGYQKGYLSVAKIADMLHQDSAFGEKLRKAIHHHFSNDTKTEVDLETNTAQTRPFFFSRYYKKILYFIKESDFIPFLERYGDWLIKNGVNETLIYQLQGKEMPNTNELISFDMFADILKKQGLIAEKIISAIKQKHLHDTFMDLDENKKLVHKPVFRAIYDPTRKRFSYYFSSQKSMFAFLRKEKDLLDKFHIQTKTVDYLKQGLEIHPYNPNYIFVSQFSKLLHVHKTGFSDFIKANYLNETITYQDTDGSLKARPIFVLMQQTRKKNTHSYAIHPDDFNTFILKHQKELSVNPYALPFILNRQPIPTVGDRYLTLTELSQLLKITGPKIVSLILGFRKMADKILRKKILNSDNTPFFVYASKQKHNPGIYFDLEQLPLFLKTYRTDLINLGVLPQSISEAVFTQTTKPDYYLKFFINQRLKVKERQQRLLKKQEGRTYAD